MELMFPECTVWGVHMVMKYFRQGREKFDLSQLKEEYLQLAGRIEHWQAQETNARKIEKALARKAVIEKTLCSALQTKPKGTGYAFVTLGSPKEAESVTEAFSRRNKEEHVQGELMKNDQSGTTIKLSKHGKMRGSVRVAGAAVPSVTNAEDQQAKAEKRALAYHLCARSWKVTMAPERGDVIWTNLSVSPKEKRARVCGVNSLVMMVLFFFTTPITMLAGLLTLSQPSSATEADHAAHTEEARTFLYDVATFGDGWPWLLRKWVREYIPTWSLLLTTLSILTAMEVFTQFERHALQSEIQKAIGWKVPDSLPLPSGSACLYQLSPHTCSLAADLPLSHCEHVPPAEHSPGLHRRFCQAYFRRRRQLIFATVKSAPRRQRFVLHVHRDSIYGDVPLSAAPVA